MMFFLLMTISCDKKKHLFWDRLELASSLNANIKQEVDLNATDWYLFSVGATVQSAKLQNKQKKGTIASEVSGQITKPKSAL